MPCRPVLTALVLLASGSAFAAELSVDGAWIRAAPPSARMLAGYAVVRNTGDAPVALVGASSPRFGMVEIHETIEVDGVARMREVPRIEIAPGDQAVLEPGGRHLMLMRPVSVPAEGESVEITLKLEGGVEQVVAFEVRREMPTESGDPHAGHDHAH